MTDRLSSLAAIAPEAHAKFSPRVHRWMTKHFQRDFESVRAWRTALGQPIYLGCIDGGDLLGSRLDRILVYRTVEMGCFRGAWKEVPRFWDGYLEAGRCFLDPAHARAFLEERWQTDGDELVCLWCGLRKPVPPARVARVPAGTMKAST